MKGDYVGDKSRYRSPISSNDQPLEVVNCFKYIGVVLSKSRSFYQTKNILCTRQGKHCLVYIKKRNLELPIDCQLKLFGNTIGRF